MSEPIHRPVLLAEVIEYLRVRPGLRCVDATVDGGGHARAMLEASAPDGRVLGIDRDPGLLARLRSDLARHVDSHRLELAQGNFGQLGAILDERAFGSADAILFDLGVSSFHFDASGRGFTFARDEPLDMRFDPTDERLETAADLLAYVEPGELARLIRDLGEERFASRIARTIVARRRQHPLRTTAQLLDAVSASLPPNLRWRAARHAARVFQALRIAVNHELDAIAEALPQAVAALAPGGRLAVISFHSLEDRLVKKFFREAKAAGQLEVITRKPVLPSEEETHENPRAASAKLRVAERL